MKKLILIILCLMALMFTSCGPRKFPAHRNQLTAQQQNNIKKHLGNVDLSKGTIWFVDLNEDGRNEIIIPFRTEVIDYNGNFGQSLNVFNSSGVHLKALNFFANSTEEFPPLYKRKLSRKYLPVILYPLYDKNSGYITTTYWTMDGKLDGQISNELRVPEDIVYYQFDKDVPTFVQVYFGAQCSYTIYKMDNLSGDPVIRSADLLKFEKLLKKYFPDEKCLRLKGVIPPPPQGHRQSQRPVTSTAQ